MSGFGDLRSPDGPTDPERLRTYRFRLVASWLALSAWEGVPIYLAFMRRSENPSVEVAVALALAMCWIPVVGTAAAVMAATWAWGLPWWVATAMYLVPKAGFVVLARALRRGR
jgi:hypothetical protein